MPLYGRKIFHPVAPLTNVKPGEEIFTIEHTGEQFRSRSEYDKRLAMYEEKAWTCQCTGHINLSHKQALASEQEKMDVLKAKFPEYFEKPVLEIVHHNTAVLDDLVDKTWTRLQQVLAVKEPVALKVKSDGQEITGKVARVDTSTSEILMVNGTSNGECNSPSSDKENKTSIDEAGADSSDGSPVKWQPPRLLPYKYIIVVDNDDKVISGIPATDIKRLKKTPSKEIVKLFIRSCSHRPGMNQASPWIVNEEMVKKHSLPSKIADIFTASAMISPGAKKSAEVGKKRKASLTPNGQSKKRKLNPKLKISKSQSVLKPNTSSNSPKKSASPKKTATPKKGTPKKPKTPPKSVQVISDSSSDSEQDSSSAEDEMPLSDIKKGKTLEKSPKKREKSLAELKRDLAEKQKKKDKKDATKKFKTKPAPKKRSSTSGESLSQSKKSKTSPKKSMKQMTLFDMKGNKKNSGSKTGTARKSSPKKQTPVKLPPIVLKLRKAMKAGNKTVSAQLVTQCAKILNGRQRAALPDDVKELVLKKYEQIAEKKKMDAMTPEQKEEYLKQKRIETKKRNLEKRLEQNKRYEDQDLDLAPLPIPKLVQTPDGLPNELFGEVAMVTQFISCYKDLLMPDDDPIMTDALMKALVADKAGFSYLAKTLQVLLQTLLQDAIAEEYKELSVPLKSVTVTPWNVSELVRLCLRKHDVDDAASLSTKSRDSEEDDDLDEEDEVAEGLIEQLETEEIYSLRPEEKLQILSGLCNRIMNSYSVQDFMEQKQRDAADLWKRKIKQQKHKNDKMREEKEKRRAAFDGQKGRPPKKEENVKEIDKKKSLKNMTITNFYGVSSADNSAAESEGDITSVLKSRRIAAARAAADKARKEREHLQRRAKETEAMKSQREFELFEKRFKEGVALAKAVYRHVPLGTDRSHNRYWAFHVGTPGLYIEKGWAPKEIDYCVGERLSAGDTDEDASPKKRKKKGKQEATADTERTFPHTGQNLWFAYDDAKDLEMLVTNLHELGIRESALKAKLKELYPDVSKAVYVPQKAENGLETSDGEADLVDGFRSEMLAMEMGLRNGGLGGVSNFPEWEKKLTDAKTIKEFGEILIESQKFISEKFRVGILAPIKQKLKVEVKKEGGEEDEVDVEYHEDTIFNHEKEKKLQEAISDCPTFSRLHFLLGIVESSVKWEKSAENAKCKICRKKRDEDYLLLCDDCNQPFHLYCLRPSLPEIPAGDWFCPSCRPLTQRRCRREPTNYRKLDRGTPVDSSDDQDSADEEEEGEKKKVQENFCAICQGDEDLIPCSTCVYSFHMECHDPPLKREPRLGTWKCMQCARGIHVRTRTRRAAAENRKRWTAKDEESEEEEEEVVIEEEDEEEVEEESEDESGESEEQEQTTTRRSSRSTSSSRVTRRQSREVEAGNSSQRTTSRRSSRRSQENDPKKDEMKTVKEVVNRVMKYKHSWPFRFPVEASEVPDYYDVITDPIDLLAMQEKCDDGMYSSAQDFVDDMALLFDNGDKYNKPESEVGKCIPVLEEFFKTLLAKHLPDCKYERFYNRATMESLAAHGYEDHAYVAPLQVVE